VEDGGSEGEREAVIMNKSKSITNRYNKPILSALLLSLIPAFLFHSPHGSDAVVFFFAGQWSCSGCHRSLWLDVCEECFCMALHVH